MSTLSREKKDSETMPASASATGLQYSDVSRTAVARATLAAFTDFINEPPSYEDQRMVRDYRHEAYRKLEGVIAEVLPIINAHDSLTVALDGLVLVCGRTGNALEDFEEQAAAFYRETGVMRPGKDVPTASSIDDDIAVRRVKFGAWVQLKIQAAREVLSQASGTADNHPENGSSAVREKSND